ncbi:MAG: arylsulfatase A-like enzyme [Chlamydiales bacterium]|jgi:arylsulfatase A-like enzyme
MTTVSRSPSALLAGLLLAGCAGEHDVAVVHGALESVLLITVDTVRPDYMSMNGYPLPTTPYLDGLLAEGSYFEHALTPIPRTTPAMASMLTGSYPHTTGVRTLTSSLAPAVRTLAEALSEDGRQTLAVVTNHILAPSRGLGRGFDKYRHSANQPFAPSVTEVALEELAQTDPERPLFMWVHYLDPHIPYNPPEPLASEFDPGYEGPHQEEFVLRGPDMLEAERARRIYQPAFSDRVNEHIRRLHAGMYRCFDGALAPLVERMQELYGEDLLIVFTADHGESLGEHGLYWDHGDYVYNATTRVPMGFVFPAGHALHGGQRITQHSSLVDVAPTILDLLGVPGSDEIFGQIEGQSLVPLMRGEPQDARALFAESGYCYYPEYVGRRIRNDVAGRFRAVFLGNWKLIWTPFQSADKAWELYDVDADPHETEDLFAPGRPEVVQLRGLLEGWMKGSFMDATPNLHDGDLEALKALGYVR